MIFLVILLGLLHGLLLLPILLTLFGPGACSRGRKETVHSSQFNILSPLTSVSDTFIYEEGRGGLVPPTVRERGCTIAAAAAASDLHLSFFKPNDSDDSEANLSTDNSLPLKVLFAKILITLTLTLYFQARAFSDSSYYNQQKRHLRRNMKNISSMRSRASSDVGGLDTSKHCYSQSLKRKFSHLQAEIKGLSPLRQSRVRIESEGIYNGGFLENEMFGTNSVQDNSMMSTFR